MKNNSLRLAIITALESDLAAAAKAAESARQTATHKESVAENKYDTFGLEASYLAHGLSMRAEQSLQAIAAYTSLPFKEFNNNDPIALTALVTVLTESDEEKVFFIGPESGGVTFTWQGKNVMVITPKTPLGQKLMGKRVDDTVEITVAGKPVTYEILKLEN
ncbi:GreA/GreB family elongation factor [Dasania marina]|uniref:GreA/GreB family elongation factor n=1 Tax=Dasania marina TaxID=471499 RepID=UPI0030DD9A40|tara:strand:- start:68332 stop:68817 length:486 start_codon:yes stop_codon:yes gene_type:complete